MVEVLKVPGLDQYYFQYKNFKAVIKAITGADLFYLAENNITINSFETAILVYKHLLIKESGPIEELDLEIFNAVMEAFYNKILKKHLLTPDNWLEIIFVISGYKFEATWRAWEKTPIETLLALLNVAKKLQKPVL